MKIHLADLDKTKWKEDLTADLILLNDLLNKTNPIEKERDTKLQVLKKLLDDKISQPFNPNNKKAIIFTAFADTAYYLYNELSKYIKKKYGLNTALVTGSRRLCSEKKIPTELNAILSCFLLCRKEIANLPNSNRIN